MILPSSCTFLTGADSELDAIFYVDGMPPIFSHNAGCTVYRLMLEYLECAFAEMR
jgi:hypothetical protein